MRSADRLTSSSTIVSSPSRKWVSLPNWLASARRSENSVAAVEPEVDHVALSAAEVGDTIKSGIVPPGPLSGA